MTPPDVQLVIRTARRRRKSVRWTLALSLLSLVVAFIAGVESTSVMSPGWAARISAGHITTSTTTQIRAATSKPNPVEITLFVTANSSRTFNGFLEHVRYTAAWSNKAAVDPADIESLAAEAAAALEPAAGQAVQTGTGTAFRLHWRSALATAAAIVCVPLFIFFGYAVFSRAALREAVRLRAHNVCPACLYYAGPAGAQYCPECGQRVGSPKRAGPA